ncbi:MAG: hypothetical protein NC254_07705 [bacterium]|nr:hypothetical protein [bacterium]
MGTFAGLFQKDGIRIPDEKEEEFQGRIEKLFQAGGMMELKVVQLCDKQTRVLKKASMHQAKMNFYYNYFEDDCWENAGFCPEYGVWSNKIGWSDFHHVVVAAYVLKSLYLDGPAAVQVNGEFVTSRAYAGWINYLFHERYLPKKNDPWSLFEALHEQRELGLAEYDWKKLAQDAEGLIGYYEVRAVLEGTAALDKEFQQLADGLNFYDCARQFKDAVRYYRKKSTRSREEQISMIMEMLRSYYAQQENMPDDAAHKAEAECGSQCDDEQDSEYRKAVIHFAVLTDAPAYVIKVLSETYRVPFWKLWRQIKETAKKTHRQREQESFGNRQEFSANIPYVSTEQFFDITSDDLILFWGDDENIRFSQELEEWFADLEKQYEAIMEQELTVSNPLYWILDLMEYADANYYCIYAFSDFFEETMEHLNDRRFLALWKIYDDMLHDPKFEKAGSVIFVPDGPEYANIGIYDPDAPSRRRLKGSWSIMNSQEKNNAARVTFRRYMALLENRKLREKVFGF